MAAGAAVSGANGGTGRTGRTDRSGDASGTDRTVGVIGVIGVGEIAEALVTGLLTGEDAPTSVVLSPRGAARAAALAERFDRVRVATGETAADAGNAANAASTVNAANAGNAANAEVVASADTVIVSVRPDQLATALDGVEFREGQLVISTLAGVDLATLRDAVGAGPTVVRSVPLPPVARRAGVTPLVPADPRAVALFDLLGGHLAVDDEEQMAAVTVLTGAQTGLLQYVALLCQWAAAHGLDPASSEMFVRDAVAGLEPGLRDAGTPVGGLIDNFETPGGLNHQLRTGFFTDATAGTLFRELDALHLRVRGE